MTSLDYQKLLVQHILGSSNYSQRSHFQIAQLSLIPTLAKLADAIAPISAWLERAIAI